MLYRFEHIISLPRDTYDTAVSTYAGSGAGMEALELYPSFQHKGTNRYLPAGSLALVSADKKEFAASWTVGYGLLDDANEGYGLMMRQVGLPKETDYNSDAIDQHLVAGKRISPVKFAVTSIFFAEGQSSRTSDATINRRIELRKAMLDLTGKQWPNEGQFTASDVMKIAKKIQVTRRFKPSW